MNQTTKSPLKKKNLWRRMCEHKVLYWMVLPCLIWLLIFCYIPMYGIVIAFKDYRYNLGMFGGEWVGLTHFKEFLGAPEFWITMKNTVSISLLKLLFGFPAPILLALLLNELKGGPFKKGVQTMSYLPNFVSWVVIVSLLNVMLSPYGGIVNNLMEMLGKEPVFFMGEKEYFYPLIIISDIWKNAGWGSIVYLAALTGIDQEMYEAAIIDGAGRLKCTWYITLPSIKETIGIMFLLALSGILNVGLDQILLFQQPANLQISEILETFILKTGLDRGQISYSTAINVFKSFLTLIIIVGGNRVSKKLTDVGLW